MTQDRLTVLEKELEEEDRQCRLDPNKENADSGPFRRDPRPRRKKLLNKIAREMREHRKWIIT